jgi:hypothetical protein
MSEIYIIKLNDKVCGYYNNLKLANDFIITCINCNFIKKKENIKIYKYQINTNICIQEIDFLQKKIINHTDKLYDSTLFSSISNIKKNKVINKKNINKKVINNDLYESTSKSSKSSKTNIQINNNIINSDSESTTYSEYTRRNIINKAKLTKMNEVGIEKSNITQELNILNLEKKKIKEKEIEFNYDLELYNKFKIIIKNNLEFIIPELFLEKFKIFEKLDNNNNITFENFYNNYNVSNIETDFDNMFNSTEHLNKFTNKNDIDLGFINENYDNLFKASHNLNELLNTTKLQIKNDNSDIDSNSDSFDSDSYLESNSDFELDSDIN